MTAIERRETDPDNAGAPASILGSLASVAGCGRVAPERPSPLAREVSSPITTLRVPTASSGGSGGIRWGNRRPMLIVRILLNAVIMAGEVAAVAGLGWLGYWHPYVFAGLTILAAFALGAVLEQARFTLELPFFFEKVGWIRKIVYAVVAVVEAVWKGLLAGLVALLTFAGTDDARRYWIAIAFALTVWLGAVLLRRLAISFDARASRWGYYRLAVPLGLAFSIGLTSLTSFGLVKAPDVWEIGRHLLLELPAKPSLPELSEVLFKLKLFFDGLVVAILGKLMPQSWAETVGILVSVNTLTGFVAAVYSVLIAEAVLRLEDLNG